MLWLLYKATCVILLFLIILLENSFRTLFYLLPSMVNMGSDFNENLQKM